MKNSIKAIFAMLAILPCALFFTACGGEKITTEAADTAFAAAVTETGKVSTDFKIELKANYKISKGVMGAAKDQEGEVTGTVKKAVTTSEKDGKTTVDDVKMSVSLKAADEISMVIGKNGEKYLVMDTVNKTYVQVPEGFDTVLAGDISGILSGFIEMIMAGSDVSIPDGMLDVDFSEMSLESETMKLDATKTGENDFNLNMKGYILMPNMAKISGEIKIEIRDGLFSKLSVNLDMFAMKVTTDATPSTEDIANADKYTEKMFHIDGSINMSFGEQKIELPSLNDYTEETTTPTAIAA